MNKQSANFLITFVALVVGFSTYFTPINVIAAGKNVVNVYNCKTLSRLNLDFRQFIPHGWSQMSYARLPDHFKLNAVKREVHTNRTTCKYKVSLWTHFVFGKEIDNSSRCPEILKYERLNYQSALPEMLTPKGTMSVVFELMDKTDVNNYRLCRYKTHQITDITINRFRRDNNTIQR